MPSHVTIGAYVRARRRPYRYVYDAASVLKRQVARRTRLGQQIDMEEWRGDTVLNEQHKGATHNNGFGGRGPRTGMDLTRQIPVGALKAARRRS